MRRGGAFGGAGGDGGQIMRTLNISGETEQMLEKRAQNTLELLPSNIRTSTLLCIYRTQVWGLSRLDTAVLVVFAVPLGLCFGWRTVRVAFMRRSAK